MPLGTALIVRLELELLRILGHRVHVRGERPLGGGSINDSHRLDTDAGAFFIKVNTADRFPSMFEAEADGLGRLRSTGTLRVPEMIAYGEEEGAAYLLLEWMEAAPRSPSFWSDFGAGLARMHLCTNDRFGLDRDNFIGSLEQVNTPHATWDAFFIHCRLEPMVRMARDARRIGMGEVLRFERLYGRLFSLFPAEPPALLHGDLWSGNFIVGPGGEPAVIDPAVYYGHREMDIAMTRLFGGFEAGFYAAYNAVRPMESGWEERMDLCNLYPLLVHVNLFGGGYAAQVNAILRRFT